MMTLRLLSTLALLPFAIALASACGDDTSGNGGSGGAGASGGGATGTGGNPTGTGGDPTGTGGDPSGTGGGSGEPPEMNGMTAAHNAARAGVNPPASPAIPPLTWTADVAATAQAYAEQCVFMHSNSNYGENLYATSGSATPAEVVASWIEEQVDYDYATNSCNSICGHYTQVVWADSLKLGCGVADCTVNSPFGSGPWQIWVCNYDPPGNYNGQKPY